MKALLFAAALTVSGVAIAQSTTNPQDQTQTPTGQTTDPAQTTDPTQTTNPAQTTDPTQTTEPGQTTAPEGTTQQPTGQTVDDPSQATGPEGITQQGTDPSGQASSPAGTNMPVQGGTGMAAPSANQGAAFTPRPAAGEYPPCSRTVTDSCVQTYQRGRRPRR